MKNIVVIAGPSGSGLSSVEFVFEELGYLVIKNPTTNSINAVVDDLLNEKTLRPIINVQPNYESVYHELEEIVLHPERIPELKIQSIEFIKKHHDYLKVARQYLDFYTQKG